MCPMGGKGGGGVHGIRFRFPQARPSVYGSCVIGKATDGLSTELLGLLVL